MNINGVEGFLIIVGVFRTGPPHHLIIVRAEGGYDLYFENGQDCAFSASVYYQYPTRNRAQHKFSSV